MRKLILFLVIVIIPLNITAEEIQNPISNSLTYSEITEKTESGDITTRTFYIDDKKIAEITQIGDEDNLSVITRTSGNIKDGVYLNKEDKKSFMAFQNGQRDGKSIIYYPTGELKEERFFKEGKPIGKRKLYYKNGKLKHIRTYYDDNSYLQEDYRQDGTLKMRSHILVTESILSDTEKLTTLKPIKVKKFNEKGEPIKE